MMFVLLIIVFINILQVVKSNTSILITPNVSPSIKYTTNCGQYNYFKVQVPTTSACDDLIISTVVTSGETDLYVSKTNTFPTKDMQTWAAYAYGDHSLKISRWDLQSSPGWYYIAVYADCSIINAPAVYTVGADLVSTNDGTDILAQPSLAANFALNTADSYKYFRFCLPDPTQDVKITLNNCYYDTNYNYVYYIPSTARTPCDQTHYTLPELIVTRNILEPTVADLGYKLATINTREVNILASDPAGNDPNGYHSGVYYVAVHAWCTPNANCVDVTWCGPCSYYADTPNMDVIVTTSTGSAQSSMSWSTYLGNVVNAASGVAITDSVACDTYKYYGFQIPSPCYDLNLALTTTGGDVNGVTEFSVGTYPNNAPDGLTSTGWGESIEWTSYNWGGQDLTISAFDPNFEGGYNCGPNKDQLCTLIIGVYAYCTNPTVVPALGFTFTPTLTKAKKIFGTPQTSQTFTSQVSGGDVNTYEFCVLDNQDVTSQLQSYYASCNCQSKYVDLEMWISKYNSEATINDLVWRVGHGSADKTLHLNTADSDTRTGSYYLYVSGYCDSQCSSGSCTCYPCNNLVNTQYAVNVDYTSSMQSSNLLPDCGNSKTCHDQCDNTFVLSDGAKAGIAIGVIVFSMLVGALAYIIYQKKIRKQKWVPDTRDEEVQLTFDHKRDQLADQESLPSRSVAI